MIKHHDPEDVAASNQESLGRLLRAITLSEGQFSLILVCSTRLPLRRKILKQLIERSSVSIQEITLHPSVNTLFSTIETAVEGSSPLALIVSGLESVVAIDELLSSTNLVRDEFRKQFPFPLVLVINDEILQKLIRLAPDFKSWSANPIRFQFPENHRCPENRAITA
ncbi:MAG: hypothetical protein F6J86_11050 [Symploca sp. SIO1B1]|nr:hypothetical protein [Symploca sp. SIO1C2]NER46222.1 hypothetical protein [Symploca sp. SIO1A3]NER94361.1 hypothetical protein [Symploca sp. SIO1B1]